MSFEGCSRITISGGTFSVFAGNQHNNHGPGPASSGSVHLVDPSEEGRLETLDQYQELKTGNIRLKRKIAESEVERTGWRRLDARRTIYAATIRGEDKEEEFLHVQYTGSDAVQVYKQDLKAFSAVKNINYVQLFGYTNRNAIPSLVFYDAPVPVSRIFERNRFSPLLYTYFSYASLAQGIDALTLLRELWVDPRTGALCKGLYVEDSSTTLYQVWSGTTLTLPSSDHPSLDLHAYNDPSVLFQYLIGTLPVRNFIDAIRWSHRASPEWSINRDVKLILSSLPGTVYHRSSLSIIARYPGDRDRWYHHPFKEWFHVPDVMRENTLVIDDRSVRFMLKPADIGTIQLFELCYDPQPWRMWDSFVDSWLSQAHGVFSQLRVEEGDWGEYSILRQFHLQFEREQNDEASNIHTDVDIPTPIYLFIRQVPCPSDDESEWNAWLGEKAYFWSSDSSGKEEISEEERLRFGLPSFRTTIKVWHDWWDRNAYDAIKMVNRHQCLDPTSLGLARSLDYPILEVVDSSTRFEEVKDDYDHTNDGAHRVNSNSLQVRARLKTATRNKFQSCIGCGKMFDTKKKCNKGRRRCVKCRKERMMRAGLCVRVSEHVMRSTQLMSGKRRRLEVEADQARKKVKIGASASLRTSLCVGTHSVTTAWSS